MGFTRALKPTASNKLDKRLTGYNEVPRYTKRGYVADKLYLFTLIFVCIILLLLIITFYFKNLFCWYYKRHPSSDKLRKSV